MVRAIDSRKPNAESYQRKHGYQPSTLSAQYGINGRYQHVCDMKRRNGGKDVAVSDINRLENFYAYEFVETYKASRTARCSDNWLKAEVHGIPRRCCGMDVIDAESDEVAKQEAKGAMYTPFGLLLHQKDYRECYWERKPAKVTDSGNEVKHSTVVRREIFARHETTQCAFGFVKPADVDRAVFIARKILHGEVEQTKHSVRQ